MREEGGVVTLQTLGVAWVLMVLASWNCAAEDQAVLQQRMHRTAEVTSLDAEGMRPWHLKLAVETFGEDGKSKGRGAIEEWWASPTLNRVVFTVPAYAGTQLRNGDGFYRSTSADPGDWMAETLLRQVVHPMPTPTELEQGVLDLRPEEMSKVKLDCLMLGPPIRGVPHPPLGLFPTYCLDSGRESLRLIDDFGGLIFTRNRTGRFLERSVPMELSISSDGQMMIKGTIETLETAPLTAADFTPGDTMRKIEKTATRVPSGVIAGKALRQAAPVYPDEAKRNHVKGAVVLHAVIGTDGRVRSLMPVSYPDGSLAVSAIKAVRQWTYQPYLLNGEATEVDTTITVNYNITP